MLYEIATLELRLWGTNKALEGISAYMAASEARGVLLGCWEVDIGVLGRLLLLRAFDSPEALAKERSSLLLNSNPFGAAEVLKGFTVETYAAFPFMPAVQPGKHGKVYEFREYELAIGGLAPTIEGWRNALPLREELSPVLIAMHAIDGPPRMLHIVPYSSLEARNTLRKELYMKKLWPPINAPEQIVKATSTIALPTSISPLR